MNIQLVLQLQLLLQQSGFACSSMALGQCNYVSIHVFQISVLTLTALTQMTDEMNAITSVVPDQLDALRQANQALSFFNYHGRFTFSKCHTLLKAYLSNFKTLTQGKGCKRTIEENGKKNNHSTGQVKKCLETSLFCTQNNYEYYHVFPQLIHISAEYTRLNQYLQNDFPYCAIEHTQNTVHVSTSQYVTKSNLNKCCLSRGRSYG